METIPDGSILSAAGFRAAAVHCGIKTSRDQPDIALIVSDGPATAAGTFTTNRFAAAPVEYCRDILPSEGIRGVAVNAGNANACTGPQGRRDVEATAALLAGLIGCEPRQVCVASTGIIGHPLPMERLSEGIRRAHALLSDRTEAGRHAERAIMTTDTVPKACAVGSAAGGRPFHVGAMAKGSGMIAPHMATLLVFVTTDAAVPARILQRCVHDVTDATLNRITVDGDTSTNDTFIVLSSGASGAQIGEDGGEAEFREALHAVMSDLSRQIVADGEGASRVIRVRVTGGADLQDAETVARAVAESQLVKCAIGGGDPNWGRIVCAAGYSGAEVRPELTSVSVGGVCVLAEGVPTRADASESVRREEVIIEVALGLGSGEATVLTCDLTAEYVRINADYHT